MDHLKFGIAGYGKMGKIREIAIANSKDAELIAIFEINDYQYSDDSVIQCKSFDELLKERCIQLRDKYNYLILYFSGGSDSETTLQSFIRSGIHLDEIVTNVFEINEKDPPLLDV